MDIFPSILRLITYLNRDRFWLKMGFKTQVDKNHYAGRNYDSLNRFVSYFSQISCVRDLKNLNTLLEVGVGNKTVSDYLKKQGYLVTTCDFDESLNPDKVGDVRSLPFENNQFDAVLCSEVLEHLPLKDLPQALSELKRVSKKYVVVSLPYYCAYLEHHFKISLGYFTKDFNFVIAVPYFFLKPKFSGEHYFGLGIRGISKRIFRNITKGMGLKIVKEFREFLNPHHYFFVMEKIK